MELSPEDLEKFEIVGEAVFDTIENIGDILTTGDRFSLDPSNFEEIEEYIEDPAKLKALIVEFARRQLGVPSAMTPSYTRGEDTFYLTNQADTFLGTDGEDWWIEIIPPDEIEKITLHVRDIAIGNPAPAEKDLSKAERLAQLREAHEVVEEDSDLIDVFMYARSDRPLTKKDFTKDFPGKKALVITPDQLEQIEAGVDDGNYFSYIGASGDRKYVRAEDMEEPLVLFLEDLGG